EIAVLKHAREFDHAPQLNLAPTATNVRRAQGLNQISSLGLQMHLRSRKRSHLFPQFGISIGARLFQFTDLAVDFLERLFPRLDELIDCALSEFQIPLSGLLKFLQSYAQIGRASCRERV